MSAFGQNLPVVVSIEIALKRTLRGGRARLRYVAGPMGTEP
jgi:hypothetical protein